MTVTGTGVSRMRKTMNEMLRLRAAYAYTPEQAIAMMEPAVLQAKTLWNFADALGKKQKQDHELYGDVPEVDALEAAARELERDSQARNE